MDVSKFMLFFSFSFLVLGKPLLLAFFLLFSFLPVLDMHINTKRLYKNNNNKNTSFRHFHLSPNQQKSRVCLTAPFFFTRYFPTVQYFTGLRLQVTVPVSFATPMRPPKLALLPGSLLS